MSYLEDIEINRILGGKMTKKQSQPTEEFIPNSRRQRSRHTVHHSSVSNNGDFVSVDLRAVGDQKPKQNQILGQHNVFDPINVCIRSVDTGVPQLKMPRCQDIGFNFKQNKAQAPSTAHPVTVDLQAVGDQKPIQSQLLGQHDVIDPMGVSILSVDVRVPQLKTPRCQDIGFNFKQNKAQAPSRANHVTVGLRAVGDHRNIQSHAFSQTFRHNVSDSMVVAKYSSVPQTKNPNHQDIGHNNKQNQAQAPSIKYQKGDFVTIDLKKTETCKSITDEDQQQNWQNPFDDNDLEFRGISLVPKKCLKNNTPKPSVFCRVKCAMMQLFNNKDEDTKK